MPNDNVSKERVDYYTKNRYDLRACNAPNCKWFTYLCEWGFCAKCCGTIHPDYKDTHILALPNSNKNGYLLINRNISINRATTATVTDPEPPEFGDVKETTSEASTDIVQVKQLAQQSNYYYQKDWGSY